MNRQDLRQPYPFHRQPAHAAAPARLYRTPKAPRDLSWIVKALAIAAVVAAVLRHV